MEQALTLKSPFTLCHDPDSDLQFAADTLSAWGPFLEQWRTTQTAALKHLDKALRPVNIALVSLMAPSVKAVAKDRNPANLAAAVSILRWPDRTLASSFVEGFKVIGHHVVVRRTGQEYVGVCSST